VRQGLSQTQSIVTPPSAARTSPLHGRGPLIWFLFNFGTAKAGTYFVPLAIAAFASAAVYGAVEFGWAVALIAASVLTGAQFGGINQRYLVQRDNRVDDELAMWTALGCGLSVMLWWGSTVAGLSLAWQVALASIGVAVIHNAASTRARMRGARVLTAWADGTATFVAGGLIFCLFALDLASSKRAVGLGYAGLATIGAIVAGGLFMVLRQEGLAQRIGRSWALGWPMLANAVLATWLGVYGRVLIGLFAAETVAAYGLMFRVAGLALAVHQLAVTALFARIYAARTKMADRLLAPFLIAVALTLVGLSLLAPVAVPKLPIAALDEAGNRLFAEIFPVVALQVFFWIGFAMLQLRINRSGLASRAFGPMLAVTLLGTGLTLVLGWLSDGDLTLMCSAIAAQSAALFAVEWIVLVKARLPHNQLGKTALIGGIALSLICVVNYWARTTS
jgi:hypothetical protein